MCYSAFRHVCVGALNFDVFFLRENSSALARARQSRFLSNEKTGKLWVSHHQKELECVHQRGEHTLQCICVWWRHASSFRRHHIGHSSKEAKLHWNGLKDFSISTRLANPSGRNPHWLPGTPAPWSYTCHNVPYGVVLSGSAAPSMQCNGNQPNG